MKINLIYNYNFIEPLVHIKNNRIYIYENKRKYILQEINDLNSINVIYRIINNNNLEKNYYKIIQTNKKELAMRYNNKLYILLEIRENTNPNSNEINITWDNDCINRSNWYDLWIKKNKYIINQYEEILRNLPKINGIIDYYIGLAENAIEYMKLHNDIDFHKKIQISSKRYIETSNPLNIVLDCKERYITEKIKYNFFELNQEPNIKEIINEIQKNELLPHRIISRLIYPTYFFDIIENMQNAELVEKQIRVLTKKATSYENLTKRIIFYLGQKYKIKNIDWL